MNNSDEERLAGILKVFIKRGLLVEVATFFENKELLRWNLLSRGVYYDTLPLAITSVGTGLGALIKRINAF